MRLIGNRHQAETGDIRQKFMDEHTSRNKRSHPSDQQPDMKLKPAETIAIVQLILDSGLLRSELAALAWGDIEV